MAKTPRKVSTFTFNGTKYHVNYADAIYGVTDVPNEQTRVPARFNMTILTGSSYLAFQSAVHEALEASGMPDAGMHDRDGNDRVQDVARFLWRTWVNR